MKQEFIICVLYLTTEHEVLEDLRSGYGDGLK